MQRFPNEQPSIRRHWCVHSDPAMESSMFIPCCSSRSGDPVLAIFAEASNLHCYTVRSKALRFHYHVTSYVLDMER
jgi:hypothetical protein